jgi:hypothetical protein
MTKTLRHRDTLARRLFSIGLVGLIFLVPGCGQPQVGSDKESLELLMKMQTAVMAKRTDLVDQVAREADELAQTDRLPSDARDVIRTVADLGKGGDWDAAQSRWLRFAKGQRPAAE